jgi:hypothetical protein
MGMRESAGFGDYVKMAFIGKVWGIPHPPGFPLYLIINGIMSAIPVGPLTFRVVMISATSTAIAMHYVYRIGRLLRFGPSLALGVALLSATSMPVWLQGVIPDVYGLHIMLLMAQVWALFKWGGSRDDRWMWLATWLFIVSLGNHPTALFALPGLLIYALAIKPRVFLQARTWFHSLGAIVILAGLYSYIYWRSLAPPMYFEVQISGDFRQFVSGYLLASDYRNLWGDRIGTIVQLWGKLTDEGVGALGNIGWYVSLFAIFALLTFSIVTAAYRNGKYIIVLVLIPIGLAAAAVIFRDAEPESWLSPSVPLVLSAFFSALLWLVEYPKNRLSLVRLGYGIALVLISGGIAANFHVNSGKLDFSGPSQEHTRALRIVGAVEAPAFVVTAGYDESEQFFYCLFTDPECFAKLRAAWKDPASKLPIVAIGPWDQDATRQGLARALSAGKHIYIYPENVPEAEEQFSLLPVDTGVSPPELYIVKME